MHTATLRLEDLRGLICGDCPQFTRTAIKQLVSDVVTRGMSKTEAIAWIRERVATLAPQHERKRLVEVVETELMSLHPGSIARYSLRPSKFEAWQAVWQ